jgi:hypothetical protein
MSKSLWMRHEKLWSKRDMVFYKICTLYHLPVSYMYTIIEKVYQAPPWAWLLASLLARVI